MITKFYKLPGNVQGTIWALAATARFGPSTRLCKVHFLRIADLGADRSERRLSALFVEMCIMQHWSRLAFMLPFTQLEIKMQGFAM
jgi:hypothetical protein